MFIVDPQRDIPPPAQAIHGISTRRARQEGCPLAEAAAIVHAVLERAQADHLPVVVINASFDIAIAAALFRSFGLRPILWEALVDPLVIDRQVDPYRSGKRRWKPFAVPTVSSSPAPTTPAAMPTPRWQSPGP